MTYDERREVAERLRADADHGVLPYFDFLGAAAYDIGCRRDPRDVLLRLADLVDPEGGDGDGR